MLQRIDEYRAAARKIVEASAPLNRRCAGLIELSRSAREEDDPEVARFAERVIFEEAAELLGLRRPPPVPVDAYGRRQLALRAEGYECCPRCGSRLATEIDVERWARH